jgi:hypothetical protein
LGAPIRPKLCGVWHVVVIDIVTDELERPLAVGFEADANNKHHPART